MWSHRQIGSILDLLGGLYYHQHWYTNIFIILRFFWEKTQFSAFFGIFYCFCPISTLYWGTLGGWYGRRVFDEFDQKSRKLDPDAPQGSQKCLEAIPAPHFEPTLPKKTDQNKKKVDFGLFGYNKDFVHKTAIFPFSAIYTPFY